ncbi:MAG TPA: phosphatase PAP2 family protein [Candidatus Nanoarchaeia archaeon]|nr:phosphatase PAP2 family protein [Candidatus Nanoarchaeia archaeon]
MQSEFALRQKRDIMRDISALGSLIFYIFLMILFFALNNYSSLAKLFIGIILMYFVTVIIRLVYFKNRPDKFAYNNIIEKIDAASFPSLHAARTGFLTVFFVYYFNNMIISVILAVLALGVLYSRVYLRKHDIRDVLAGAVLGVFVHFAVNFILA